MEVSSTKVNIVKRLFSLVVFSFLFLFAPIAHAASLYLSPSSGTYAPQESFTVSVYASSTDQVFNAVSGTITFPPSVLQVTGLSKAGSIMSLWAQEPSYSNTAGTITFEGIVLNPGYSGSSGKILSITFSPATSGTSSVAFSGGSILANDGLGTNILQGYGSASFTIVAHDEQAPSQETEESPASAGVPDAPSISSSTHPDPLAWYAQNDPVFSWVVPSGVDGVNVLADKNSNTNPGTVSDGLRSSYTYTDVDDGAWYFHIRLHNAAGWGDVSHFAFNIDTTAPVFADIHEVPPSSSSSPTAFYIEASDALSGVASYMVSINGGPEEFWIDDGSHIYTPSVQTSGTHHLVFRALDAAGNDVTSQEITYTRSTSLVMSPDTQLSFALSAPDRVEVQSPFTVSGTTTPLSTVIVWTQSSDSLPSNVIVESDASGVFSATLTGLPRGSYRIWAQIMGEGGVLGMQSSPVDVHVFDPVLRAWIGGSFAVLLLVALLFILVRTVFPLLFSLVVFLYRKITENQYRRSEQAIRIAIDVVAHDVARASKRSAKQGKSKRSLGTDIDRLEKLFTDAMKNLKKDI